MELSDQVSILVFLDQALKDLGFNGPTFSTISFNPCFPGSSAESWFCSRWQCKVLCFNPCFPGSSAESEKAEKTGGIRLDVSILVFLDQALKGTGG